MDGSSIGVADVERTARTLKLDPTTALDRLIAERLLVQEAQRRGVHRAEAVEHVARQAAVQLLLEREVEHVAVSEDAIAEAYNNQSARFIVPERRASLHVLVTVKRDDSAERQRAAERVANGILRELSAADDPKTVWETYRGVAEREGFTIKAENVPAAARTDAFAPEYLDALYSRPEPGLVEASVRTDFGWHAIIVTTIVPAQTTTLEQARATLRAELLLKTRQQALEELVATLMRRHRVERDKAAIDALLQADATTLGLITP